MDSLPTAQRVVVDALVGALRPVPGVAAIALGGSWAAGTQRPDSDVDLGLYYRESDPPDVAAMRAAVAPLDVSGAPVVTDFWEWGPWVNGGAWLRTRAGRVDLLYRSLDHVERVIDAAWEGVRESHYFQQPVYGFHSVIYLAETRICVSLWDPDGALAGLKERVASYPPALRRSTVQDSLWGAEFTLYHARGHAARGDAYTLVGCVTRVLAYLTQALFALNDAFFLSDKTALAEIEAFSRRPEDYAERVGDLLARPGRTAAQLQGTLAALEGLFAEVAACAGAEYQSQLSELTGGDA